jgi:hypothetical protein
LLLREFVKLYKEHEEEMERKVKAGELDPKEVPDITLPTISYACITTVSLRLLQQLTSVNRENVDKL